ncbi:hypothetical protein SLS60_011518 [Paraconiothyrium brasiliense]|uniref:Uncharacterized protein n=1 Tax=Paraconiothyrium brasiliense TaxID=300254 RepID=A0ABR3QIE2_9PLEO
MASDSSQRCAAVDNTFGPYAGAHCALILGTLSYFEHSRCIRTSFLLNVYLIFTVIFDTARSRSYSLDEQLNQISILFTTRVGVKLFLAGFEARGKGGLLLPGYTNDPPEAAAGVYNRSLFWWQNALFKKGFSNTLSIDDLYQLDRYLQAEYLHAVIGSAWDKVAHVGSNSLLIVTLKKLILPILSVVPPRLCLTAFNFCQPFLIDRAVTYSAQAQTAQTTNIGYGLIGAYVLVYVGIAVSTGQYQHFTFRFITMMRGGLISMLYNKAVDIPLNDVDTASSLTLMSADIERIVTGMQTGHEIWANTIEVGLAIYLLQRQLGVACAIPVGVAVLSFGGSLVATSMVMQKQALWLEGIERRIAATTAMLSSMRGVKMTGLTDVLREDLQRLRVEELTISRQFRKLLIWTMAISFSAPLLSPILTFAVFSILAQKSNGSSTLDTAKVFTSLSLFTLLSEPLSSLIMSLSSFMGGVGSFQRIQKFLVTPTQVERRRSPYTVGTLGSASDLGDESDKDSDKSQKSRYSLDIREVGSSSSTAVLIENGCFGWDQEKQPEGCLQAINMAVPRGKITMVVGPVGCGKSTLIKAILGELPVMGGTVQLSSMRIALCDQTPWHVNGTVQQSIIGASEFDQRWYAAVVRSCALDEDLRQLPQGDQTQALARAVYAQRDIVILDDCLSGLDGQTENRVWHSLFGQHGLLRRCRTTVLIASSSAKRLPYCDHIVALSKEGSISEQGTFEKLNGTGGYVANFDLPPPDWDFTPEKHVYEAPPRYSERANKGMVTEEDIQAETNRRTGDVAIYYYYIKSVGWTAALIFMVSVTLFIFGQSFPSKW